MKALVDRPRPPRLTIENGRGAGKTVFTSYSWGEDGDLLPKSVRVSVDAESGEKFIDEVVGPFSSLEEAVAKALRSATDWYERGNG
ncbi:hypothetical protein ACUYGA_16895 [Metapseudomonas otitidis]|uniref:hypothetical protein n=1 Tax=Metapseudomonas otitidis TaxID=319939 RepID=UPI0040559092